MRRSGARDSPANRMGRECIPPSIRGSHLRWRSSEARLGEIYVSAALPDHPVWQSGGWVGERPASARSYRVPVTGDPGQLPTLSVSRRCSCCRSKSPWTVTGTCSRRSAWPLQTGTPRTTGPCSSAGTKQDCIDPVTVPSGPARRRNARQPLNREHPGGGGRNRTAVRGFAGANTWFATVRPGANIQFRVRTSSNRFAPIQGMPRYLRGMKPDSDDLSMSQALFTTPKAKPQWRLEASEVSDGAEGLSLGWQVQPLPKQRSI